MRRAAPASSSCRRGRRAGRIRPLPGRACPPRSSRNRDVVDHAPAATRPTPSPSSDTRAARGVRLVSSASSVMPRMPFIGVRISCACWRGTRSWPGWPARPPPWPFAAPVGLLRSVMSRETPKVPTMRSCGSRSGILVVDTQVTLPSSQVSFSSMLTIGLPVAITCCSSRNAGRRAPREEVEVGAALGVGGVRQAVPLRQGGVDVRKRLSRSLK